MYKASAFLSLVSLLLFAACNQKGQTVNDEDGLAAFSADSLKQHISVLAADSFMGRKPFTEGETLTINYLQQKFAAAGLEPGNGNSFVQEVPMVNILATAAPAMQVQSAKGNFTLKAYDDYIIWTDKTDENISLTNSELVFAGYGVDIPGGYSDYNSIDVKGKIVVIINGVPDGLPSTLAAHFSSAGNKMNIAFAKGAVGVINAATISRSLPSNTNPAVQLNVALNPEKTTAYGRGFTGNLKVVLNATYPMLQKLFMNSGKNCEQVVNNLKKGTFSSFELPYSINISYNSIHTDFESYNVVGLIPGTDKVLKNEYVVHSAHLDHLGISRVVNGDSIYNGAHDNASGVASLLEIARVYKSSGAKPRRSILIVMVTAEEMGLLGSSYFAANPTVPKNSIVADVNTDMPTVIAPLLSVVPLGAEHSSLMSNVQFAAKYLGLDVEKDPEPSENRFVRSDQYSFVMSGIPALHIKYGTKSEIPGFDLTAFVKQWRAKYYHQSADGMDGIFNFTAAKKYVQLNFLISYSIAQTTERPKWNAGDLFGASLSK